MSKKNPFLKEISDNKEKEEESIIPGNIFCNKNLLKSENNNNSLFGPGLFGSDNNSVFETNNNSVFGAISFFGTNNNNIIFGAEKEKSKVTQIKCQHERNYCAFCLENSVGPICYDCIYQNKLYESIPMNENLEYYKELSVSYLSELKNNIKKQFDELLKKIEDLEKSINDSKNFDDLSKNINLYYEFPLTISFENRIEIGINKKVTEMQNKFIKEINLNNIINLYNTKLTELKTQTKLDSKMDEDTITISSKKEFNLKGFGILKMNLLFGNNIEFNNRIYETKGRTAVPIEFEEKDNLTLIKFKNSFKIGKNPIMFDISGIKDIPYINEEEKKNKHNNIEISSSSFSNFIACILIE